MTTKVEVSYETAADEAARLRQVGQILADAVSAYLKRRGLSTTAGSPNATRGAGTGTGAKILEE